MTIVSKWAAAKVDAAGAWIIDPDAFVGAPVKTGPGVYELTLQSAMGVSECGPEVTPTYLDPAAVPGSWANACLKADGITVVVNIFTSVGGVTTPTDGAFSVVIWRFMQS